MKLILPRYGLRTLLGLTMVAAMVVWIVLRLTRADEFRRTIAEIEARGSWVETFEDGNVVALENAMRGNETVELFKLLKRIPRLKTVAVFDKTFSDEEAKLLPALDGLRDLYVGSTGVTDLGVQSISRLTTLEELDLSHTKVTNQCVFFLDDMPNLTTLSLVGTQVTGGGLIRFQEHRRLRKLKMDVCLVSDRGCREISRLTSLQELSLKHTQITDEGFAEIGRLVNLRKLDLQGNHVHGAGLKYLSPLANLECLSLSKGNSNAGSPPWRHALTQEEVEEWRALGDDRSAESDEISLEELPPFERLNTLDLGCCRLNAASFERLTGLPALRSLNLKGSNVSDREVAVLGMCKSLKEVFVDYTEITDDGKARLRRLLGDGIALSLLEQIKRDRTQAASQPH